MSIYYFDSSAVVKRYVTEIGSSWVTSVAAPSSGNTVHLARITPVEVVSAIARLGRTGSLSATAVVAALTQFRRHLRNQYRKVEIQAKLVLRAMSLVELHGLRGYDAVQLAAALETHARCLARGTTLTLVSADAELNLAAAAEGLVADDPNLHP